MDQELLLVWEEEVVEEIHLRLVLHHQLVVEVVTEMQIKAVLLVVQVAEVVVPMEVTQVEDQEIVHQ